MAGEAQETESLRDVISGQVEKLEETSAPPVDAPAAAAEPAAATSTGERARDDLGRFVPKDAAAELGKSSSTPPPAQDAKTAPAAAPAVQRPPRPSSWAKDYWQMWDALDPKLAEYINKREGDYAKGVSTYKTEFDRLKPFGDAVAQFLPDLERAGMKPEAWIQSLGNAHRVLAMGSPQDKLSMFLKLAQDYQVPVQSLFQQGQDGRVYYSPQVQPYQPPAQQQPNIDALIDDRLSQKEAQRELAAFEREAPTKYPHYEAVKATMAQLLEANLSQTLPEAYDDALRQRQHADLYAQVQQAEAEKAKAEAARKAQEEAARARRQSVSPRSSTPAVRSGDGKPKSVRESIEAAAEQHMASDRV